MLAMGGFVLGYLLGARAGREGLEELVDAWNTIRGSDEFRAIVSGAGSMVSGVLGRGLRQGRGTVTGKVASVVGDGTRRSTSGRVRAV